MPEGKLESRQDSALFWARAIKHFVSTLHVFNCREDLEKSISNRTGSNIKVWKPSVSELTEALSYSSSKRESRYLKHIIISQLHSLATPFLCSMIQVNIF